MRFPMVQPVTDMTKAALGPRLASGAAEYLDMFEDAAVFEFPFSPSGAVRIDGKPAMADYLTEIEGATVFDRFDLKATYPLEDDGMVLEYHAAAQTGSARTPFEQDYVAVIQTDRGRISRYREYVNPLNIPGVSEQAGRTALDTAPLDAPSTNLGHILRLAFGDLLDTGAGAFVDWFADDGVLECPFAPPGARHRVAGKEEIAAYYARLTAVQASDGMVLTANHPVEDPGIRLLEYDGLVRNLRDQTTYRQQYLAVTTVKDGRLTLFREYWNPLPVVSSFGPAGPVPADSL